VQLSIENGKVKVEAEKFYVVISALVYCGIKKIRSQLPLELECSSIKLEFDHARIDAELRFTEDALFAVQGDVKVQIETFRNNEIQVCCKIFTHEGFSIKATTEKKTVKL